MVVATALEKMSERAKAKGSSGEEERGKEKERPLLPSCKNKRSVLSCATVRVFVHCASKL